MQVKDVSLENMPSSASEWDLQKCRFALPTRTLLSFAASKVGPRVRLGERCRIAAMAIVEDPSPQPVGLHGYFEKSFKHVIRCNMRSQPTLRSNRRLKQ